jgi:hypothetical protein
MGEVGAANVGPGAAKFRGAVGAAGVVGGWVAAVSGPRVAGGAVGDTGAVGTWAVAVAVANKQTEPAKRARMAD